MSKDKRSVWVIFLGPYGEDVLGVYSTKAHAEAVLAQLPSDNPRESHIVEMELDAGLVEINQGLRVYSVIMVGGGPTIVEHCDCVEASAFDIRQANVRDGGEYTIFGRVWASDKAHAEKLGHAFRDAAIAEGRIGGTAAEPNESSN